MEESFSFDAMKTQSKVVTGCDAKTKFQVEMTKLLKGDSEFQFKENVEAKELLVVPEVLLDSFAETIRPHLRGFRSIIGELRALQG